MLIVRRVPLAEDFERLFRTRGFGYYDRSRTSVEGPMPSYETLLERWLQEATLANGRRWSRAAHGKSEVMLSLFVEDCPHLNPEEDPKYEGVEFFQKRVTDARYNYDRRWQRRPPDPYVLAFMEAATSLHPLVAEFEQAMCDWEDSHGIVCTLSPQGTVCRECAEAREEWDDDGMEPAPCYLHDDAVEAYGEFWYANGERRED